jgi:hypothetical protein
MKNIYDLNNGLLAVVVPKDEDNYVMDIILEDDFCQLCMLTTNKDEESGFFGESVEACMEIHPIANYEILGTAEGKDISFDCEPYVECLVNAKLGWRADGDYSKIPDSKLFRNYKYDKPQPTSMTCGTPAESFLSLLESKGIDVNKLGDNKLLILKTVK